MIRSIFFVHLQKFFGGFSKIDANESELNAYHICPLPCIGDYQNYQTCAKVVKATQTFSSSCNEMLPSVKTLIKRLYDKIGYKTSIFNCIFSVQCCGLFAPVGNKKIFVPVRNLDDINKLQKSVIRVRFKNSTRPHSNLRKPMQKQLGSC